jgi:hypothetical protein
LPVIEVRELTKRFGRPTAAAVAGTRFVVRRDVT